MTRGTTGRIEVGPLSLGSIEGHIVVDVIITTTMIVDRAIRKWLGFQIRGVIILSPTVQATSRVFSVEIAIVVVQLIIAIQYDRLICDAVSKGSMRCAKPAQHAYHSC